MRPLHSSDRAQDDCSPRGFISRSSIRLTLALLATFPFAAQLAAGPNDLRKLETALRVDVTQGFSGAVLVERSGVVLLDRGFGVEQGVAVRPTSRFWIASTGKQFVSAAVLKCQERGWLTLDDQLGRFFPFAPPDKRDITVGQLLAHLSGLDQTYASEGASTRDDAVRRMLARPAIDTAGKAFHYSNDNYQLAAAIVELVSGVSYREFVAQALWRPLGMRDTGFNFTRGAQSVLPARQQTPDRLMRAAWGEAGVYSTTRDLRLWYRALAGGRVLKPENVSTLFAPQAHIQEGEVALGWFLGKTASGTRAVFTRGNEDFGANSLIYAFPHEKTLVIVLSHAGAANDNLSWSRFVLAQVEGALNL